MTFPSRKILIPLMLLCIFGISLYTAEALDLNRRYKVSVEVDGFWKEIKVYDALCSNTDRHDAFWRDWDNSLALRDTMAFAIFENGFDGPVKVRVEKLDGRFRKVEVRPTPYGIKAKRSRGRIAEFTIPSYGERKVSVEFDGDRYHNLFIIGARPDSTKPDAKDPSVHYFPEGEHNIGVLRLKNGESLYADYGAILYGNVEICGSDVSIAGNGIISGERNRHHGNQWYSCGKILLEGNPERIKGMHDLSIRNVTLIDGPSWNLSVFNCDNVTVDNVNAISWSLNGDGIDITCCKDVVVKDCFLRNYDDCITVKTRFNAAPVCDCCNVEISGCICWNDYARGIVVGIENGNTRFHTGHVHDVLVHDCIILENSRSTDLSDLRAGFAIGLFASPDHSWSKGTAMDMENVTARNITFDNIRSNGRNVAVLLYPDMDGTCTLRNVLLENFTVMDNGKRESPAVEIDAKQHEIQDMTIRNLTVNGRKISAADGTDCVIRGKAEVTFE